MNAGPLKGVKVLELSRYIAAPVAGKALGEMGADVVKVEDPGRGDPMRYWQSGDRPYSPQFAAYNRNKRGITLDLKTPEGSAANGTAFIFEPDENSPRTRKTGSVPPQPIRQ